jgi:hypothetical protein
MPQAEANIRHSIGDFHGGGHKGDHGNGIRAEKSLQWDVNILPLASLAEAVRIGINVEAEKRKAEQRSAEMVVRQVRGQAV